MSFTLAIVGRPNVGKSTLFNRLVGKRLALVDDSPGVTRDLREGEAHLGPLEFTVIDTAGLEDATDNSLEGRMRALTERAIAEADACLFLIDARAGVTPMDETLADLLRRADTPVLLAANKSEGAQGEAGWLEAFGLGLGEPIRLSGEHGEGMEDLYSELAPIVDAAEVHAAADPLKGALKVAIMGRPNAGKSTLINKIIGEDRLLTGPEAGITRDSISIPFHWGETPVRLFDTAGMRKKARVQEKLEKLSVGDGLRAVKFAEVVVVLLEADRALETQDLRIADLAEREGRALVIAINKWDTVEHGPTKRKILIEEITRLLPQMRGVEVVTVSALTGKGIDRLHEAVVRANEVWNKRIATAKLNAWLADMVQRHPPPAPGGRRIRLRYMTQVKARPPSFVAMCSLPDSLPDAYKRYLVGGLREDFDLNGTPIRLAFRKQDNPFKGKKEKRFTRLGKKRDMPRPD